MITSRKKSILSLAIVASLLLSLFSASVSAADPKKEQDAKNAAKGSIQSYVQDMQPGWNLGNTLDATGIDETTWGNPRVTKELIEQIAAQGYKSIRIPITWDQHIGDAPNYTIEPAYMNRVQEVVDWALDADLYVMINIHHDSWLWVSHMEKKHDEVLARYQATWTQIADRFKDHSNKLMFESINEPRFTDGGTEDRAKQNEMLYELLTSFHKIVRESGGKNAVRPLVLPTRETNPSQEDLDVLYNTIVKLNDPNLIATVHFYGFWPFSVNIAGYYKFEKDTTKDIVTTFDNVSNTFVAKGIPVILGEYGLLGFDKNTNTIEQGEKLKFFEFLTNTLREKKVTSMLWDNGQHFNRTTYKWSDEELINIMKAGWSGRSSTAESDIIYLAKGAEIQDAKVNLNLNGNQLTGIVTNGQKLKQGEDFVLNGEELVLKSSLLTKLTTVGNLGVNAVLSVQFNNGPDWKLKLTVNDKPVLHNAEGTTEAFAIPTNFNGNRVATMEATYAAGGNAGPQDWTSFKEYGNTFSPSFMTDEIKLLPDFFKDVKDGEVILKFHFWSGEIVTYTITKKGDNIVGKTS
ncbi:aryl-phospho-beta-D-glucosidase BglC (GH1 family) [Paenibacillus anaericanus]|uniref:cellulase family glycosylhydrolase n=1 Tax=Paenibacillus anaericanus TaxID=170367 RepID=UPI0027889B84|nr:cellulase family glycosylhydrolase [Paenibacillus anaericanus]MDQ0087222.1 aryl-phospho-beta-D-glucosidase BglC (GH1 family) [Paenibacillus anaericanus]